MRGANGSRHAMMREKEYSLIFVSKKKSKLDLVTKIQGMTYSCSPCPLIWDGCSQPPRAAVDSYWHHCSNQYERIWSMPHNNVWRLGESLDL